MNVADARNALEDAVSEWAGCSSAVFDGESVSKAIDALIAAVRAELTAPGERLPELVEAENLLREEAASKDAQFPGYAKRRLVIVRELDSLRARLAQAEALPRKGSCYDCGGTGCDSCDGTGDAGKQVLKLADALHAAEVRAENAEAELSDVRACFENHNRAENELRERCAHAEAELTAWKEATECETPREAHDGWNYTCEERDAETVRANKLEAENAELRKLCGMAAKWAQVPRVSMEDAGEFEQCLSELEAAARRAGK